MTYKEKFFTDRDKDLKDQYKALRNKKIKRPEALKILEPIFDLTPATMTHIMSNKKYGKKIIKKNKQ